MTDLIARLDTADGTTVDITYASSTGFLVARCAACPWEDGVRTGATEADPPEKQNWAIDRFVPEAREIAQSHTH
ncbi:hypothetical protein ACWIG4_27185 [Streptomyces sp. NPDC002248]